MRPVAEHSTPKPREYFEYFNSHVLEVLPEEARRFLEVGCGGGRLGEELKKRRPGAVVHGLELDPHAQEAAGKRLDRVFQADLNRPLPPLEAPYDCVICADILEHLVDPWTTLRRLVATLDAGGHVVASIPNLRFYKVLRELVVRGRFTYRESGVLDSTHLRFFTLPEMRELFTGAGLEVVRVKPRLRGGNFFVRLLDRVVRGRLEPFRAVQYTLVGRKVESGPPV